MLKIGNEDILDVVNGSEYVNEIYSGSDLVWNWTGTTFPADGLISYFRLNDNANDEQGYCDLIPNNIDYVAGKVDNGVKLNANTDYLAAPDNTYFDFERTDPFSFSAWVKFDVVEGNKFIFSKGINSSPYRGVVLYTNGNKKLIFALIGELNTSSLMFETKFVPQVGVWYHLVWTYDGSSTADGMKVYIDFDTTKVNVNENNLTTSVKTDAVFNIGNRDNGNLAPKAIIDEVGFWNRVLNKKEVYQLYNRGVGKTIPIYEFPTNGLLGYYKLDDNGNDEQGYADLTPNNVVWETGKINNCSYLNEGDSKLSAPDSTYFDFERTDAFTISWWGKKNRNESNGYVFAKYDLVSGIIITNYSETDYRYKIFMKDVNGNGITFNITDSRITDGEWHLYTWSYDGSSDYNGHKFYIDSQLASKGLVENNLTDSIKNTVPFEIGYNNNSFHGWIDEFGVWNRVLNQAEIEYLYNNGEGNTYTNTLKFPYDGMIAYYKLNEKS